MYLIRALLISCFIYGQSVMACRVVCSPDQTSAKLPEVLILCGLDHEELFTLIIDQANVASGLHCLTDKTDRLLANCKTKDPKVSPQASVIFYRSIKETIIDSKSGVGKKHSQKKLKVVFSQEFKDSAQKPKVKTYEYDQDLNECQSTSDR